MSIVFIDLPKYLDLAAILIKKVNANVFYSSLKIDKKNQEIQKKRVDKLKKYGVSPLPIDSLSDIAFPDFSPELHNKLKKRASQILDNKLIDIFSQHIGRNKDFEKKIKNYLITLIHEIYIEQIAKVVVWSKKNLMKKYWFFVLV